MNKLSEVEKEVTKSCAIRNDLTESDVQFIKNRVEGVSTDKTKYKCPKCRAKFIHFKNALDHLKWYH